jgi:MFS family permease
MELLARLFSATIGASTSRVVSRLSRTAAFGLAAAFFAAGLLIFLIAAGFLWLHTLFPAYQAALIVAGVMLVLMLLCILPLVFTGRRRRARAADKRAEERVEATAEELAPIVQVLKAAGLHGEAAAILAGAELAGRVRPIYLVGAAVVVGLMLGRRLDRRGPRDKSDRK